MSEKDKAEIAEAEKLVEFLEWEMHAYHCRAKNLEPFSYGEWRALNRQLKRNLPEQEQPKPQLSIEEAKEKRWQIVDICMLMAFGFAILLLLGY
ncbi:MAG: hypothetical protein IT371_22080 [Deltaproteobacteria bacterium]|nr:hypothetical protein [Deltaproteobacteria bacterium]